MDRLHKYTKQLNIMILSLEDDKDTLELMEHEFRDNGFELENCKFLTDPVAAIEEMKKTGDSPAICILDYSLPGGMTGLSVLKEVKAVNRDCMFIGFTGMQNLRLLREWVNSGLHKWVDKNEPGYLAELTEYVREAIGKIKDDFEWHAFLANEITTMKAKRNESRTNR